jgi:vacuolar protein sorting-associated protein 26
LGALTGGGSGLSIEIRLTPPQPTPCTTDGTNIMIVPVMDHTPSWRLHKNPFWRVKHPAAASHRSLVGGPPPVAVSAAAAAVAPLAPPGGFPQQQPQQLQYGNNNMMDPQMQQQQQQQQQRFQQQPYGGASMIGSPTGAPPPLSPGMNPSYPAAPTPSLAASTSSFSMGHSAAGGKEIRYAYEASQDVEGVVVLRLPPGKKTEHLGIRVQFIGRIDMSVGIHEGKPHYDFVSLSKELSPPGFLFMNETYLPFKFRNMEKEFESYRGRNVSVRYIIKVMVDRKFLPPLTKEHDVWVQCLGHGPVEQEAIKMEVGIEECLHIEFEYDRRHYHLQDIVRGTIRFLLVRIKIKHMELAVLRRETSGEGVAAVAAAAAVENNINMSNNSNTSNKYNNNNNDAAAAHAAAAAAAAAAQAVDSNSIFTETQTLIKYELMDSGPVKGVEIPVKLFLSGIPADLTPTYTPVNNRFSVRYFLNLVLVDEDDRRYFKQQEIILWRKELG